ncbi:hypothetical protein P3W85_09105 [Cupriavidus basilensis]|uniref:Uncharacterized protein n=1 Tax=Cupriavidus basilensis TaxID=68895 RepID=A0ABT6AKH6_9BURK|nr:hypothetical protein [Cupriavidus basilensis]MDF3833106.1 hypothetical protein [Cupriavidus basilensis]
MQEQAPTRTAICLQGLRELAATLTAGSLLQSATLQVIAEYERDAQASEDEYCARRHGWD